MTAVVVVVVAVVLGVPVGVWLRHQPKQQQSHAGIAAGAGVYLACAACGHEHDAEQIRRQLYLGQRTIGDLQALKRGRLVKRLVRRAVTKRLMRALWRS